MSVCWLEILRPILLRPMPSGPRETLEPLSAETNCLLSNLLSDAHKSRQGFDHAGGISRFALGDHRIQASKPDLSSTFPRTELFIDAGNPSDTCSSLRSFSNADQSRKSGCSLRMRA